MQLCVTKAADITDMVTIHPGYVSPHGRLVPQKVWTLHKEALREIGETGIDTGVRVCLENMPKIPDFLCMEADEHYGMIEGVEGIYATVDLGHANTTGQVEMYLNRIETATHMHIHDNHGGSDEHLALGAGTIDWDNAGRRISAAYHGICVVEGRNLDEAAISRDVFRRCF